jgi:hypothetical protein
VRQALKAAAIRAHGDDLPVDPLPWADVDLFGGTGVVELKDAAQPLAGTDLWLAGLIPGTLLYLWSAISWTLRRRPK